ncbi:Dph6-related ATP pyrophosphatase [Glaciimonas soli]|uniref:Diphthine--ammonia ligase n=1 Tax=Glaciimonas soli TaxID=2590999 RepID=A0A843YRJ5_9BURK|nr:diphthine--ammonia ligase [Glaciimonas soli]MQR00617.1 diphthine--ammonia ligase [Glaciimonas soli]
MNNSETKSDTALVSWSGGKDSCLALWRAQKSGMTIQRLITAMDESGQRARSHGVPPSLLAAQAVALGTEITFYHTSWQTYEAIFIETLRKAHGDGIRHAIFGDIDLQAHRDWEEKVCAQADLQVALPLWDEARLKLVQEFLSLGFKAVVVCVNGKHLSKEFCGREFDAAFIADLPETVDACGENGEFHTFVYDGPNFAQPVAFERVQIEDYQSPPELGGALYYFQTLRECV